MNTKTTLSVSDARKNIFSIIDQVSKLGSVFTLTEKGKPKAVIMSAEEFESWVETFEVMRDFPNLTKTIREVERDIKNGAYKTYPTLEEVMLEHRGYAVAEKKKKYGLSNKNKIKRSEGSR